MNTTTLACLVSLGIGAVMGAGTVFGLGARVADAQDPVLNLGPRATDIRFDETGAGRRPMPVVPKTWRFVGASNGEKMNSSSLWFEDKDGQIFLVQGFLVHSEFTLSDRVQRLNRR